MEHHADDQIQTMPTRRAKKPTGRGEQGPQALVIGIDDRYAPGDYWLHLEAPITATLRALDGYLRDLWLECCGHLSIFEIDGRTYAIDDGLPGGAPDPFR
jgi:hypothetical protein